MKETLRCLLALSLLSMGAPTLLAHHSFAAEYDRAKSTTLVGTVTKVEWMNPHVYFYVDVADSSGKVTNWAVELGNPAGLYRRGWRKEALKIGGTVTVAGWMSKNGSERVNANTVTMEGKKLFAGSSADQDEK